MARPPKTGLNYFPLDVDFFDDPKVCAVIVEHGIKGQAAVIMLLCAIYRNGYYIEWTPENYIFLLRQLPGVTISKMQKIVKTLVEWGFFDRTMFEKHQVLTSHGIQLRYLNAARRRKYISDTPTNYWIAEDTGENDDEHVGATDEDVTNSDSDDNDTDGQQGFMHAETQEMPAETTQEDNKKIIENYQSPSTTHTREAVEKLKNNQSWMDVVCMRHHLSREQLEQRLEEFVLDCECRGKPTHDSMSDAQSHFCNWLLIIQKQESKQDNNKTSQDNNKFSNYENITRCNQRRTSADYIEEAKQWAIERSIQFLQSSNDGGPKVQAALPF